MAKIQDYAIIGNGRSIALISRNGSINWLCWPQLDSSSIFAAILDEKRGGYWTLNSVHPAQIQREYLENTNILKTRYITDTGILIVTDFMPAFSEEEKKRSLQPEQELIRTVECEKGEVEFQTCYHPQPNYGRDQEKLEDRGVLGICITTKGLLITLRSSLKLKVGQGTAFGQTKIKSGQKLDFSLSCTSEGPAVLPTLDLTSHKLNLTKEWWQNWCQQMTYEGSYKKQVTRSALVLKLLGYAPTGAFIAAPTTSLPEKIGGDLNWDYRYCWLRDAAFTVRALFGLGYKDEAEAFVSWLLHSTRLSLPALKVVYDVYGEGVDKDRILPHLQGYEKSPPVRVGNGVGGLFELDVHGEVIEAVAQFVREGGKLDREMQSVLLKLGKYVCENWNKVDSGIWEKMPYRHFTHSKLMCWVALDRLIELHKGKAIECRSIIDFHKNREWIRREIEEKGWNDDLQSYTQYLNGTELDSTLLVMPFYDFDNISSYKMKQTYQKIKERLSPIPGLLYRYEKSVEEGEGVFGLCSFWNVEFLARGEGTVDEAYETFNKLLTYSNDLGLFAEEIDPKTGNALGNFPQAFTHVGLINAALALAKRENEGEL